MLDSLENVRIKSVIFSINQSNIIHRPVIIVLNCIEVLGYETNVSVRLFDSKSVVVCQICSLVQNYESR